MYKYILQQAGNIDWMALGPLLLFTIFFIGVSIYAITKEKKYIDHVSHLPLSDNSLHTSQERS